MLSFFLMIRQFGQAITYAWKDVTFRFLGIVTFNLLLIGTLFYHWIEGWRLLDSLYFCVITLATVGYGDFSPSTDLGKIFAMLYIFVGIGLVIAVFTRLADALLATQRERFEEISGQPVKSKNEDV